MIRSKTFLFPIPNSLLEIVERFSDDLIIVLMMNIAYIVFIFSFLLVAEVSHFRCCVPSLTQCNFY